MNTTVRLQKDPKWGLRLVHQPKLLERRQVVANLSIGEQDQDGLHPPSPIVLDGREADAGLLRLVIGGEQFPGVSGDGGQLDDERVGRCWNQSSISSTVSTMRACGLRMTFWPSPLQT